ncbi:PEP-CTERM sorting domain-containing protein [Roseiarcus fermentans]|uniref:PEP-CTERM sorting domain-containing protein n=1 Tax=Roseiarcus fermentans TaxID=1473586 RepID=UPI001474B3B8|nr:PEP-CTERM sorting domain-containing protein [Roseiarcus fermentans]
MNPAALRSGAAWGVSAMFVLSLTLGSPSASAQVFEIGGSTLGTTTIQILARGTSWSGYFGSLQNSIEASGGGSSQPGLMAQVLNGASCCISHYRSPTTFYVTETGLTGGTVKTFQSYLEEDFLPPNWSVTETTWLDNADRPFGMRVQLATNTVGPGPGSAETVNSRPIFVRSLYSLTDEFVVGWSPAGSDYATENIVVGSSASASRALSNVPEPSTWTMMVLGFAGLGFAGYRWTKVA